MAYTISTDSYIEDTQYWESTVVSKLRKNCVLVLPEQQRHQIYSKSNNFTTISINAQMPSISLAIFPETQNALVGA
jgi:hypothetical protein